VTCEGVPFVVDIFDDFMTVFVLLLRRTGHQPTACAVQPSECEHFMELAEAATMSRSLVGFTLARHLTFWQVSGGDGISENRTSSSYRCMRGMALLGCVGQSALLRR
jgi:hypothetical protein